MLLVIKRGGGRLRPEGLVFVNFGMEGRGSGWCSVERVRERLVLLF